jgi:hypothetical protein
VKARRTAAIVVRSLWAALGEVWVVGLVVDRLVVCGLVVGSVVVVGAIGFLCGKWVFQALKTLLFCGREGPTAGALTSPRPRDILLAKFPPPRNATASTHHRRDE